MQTGFEIHLKAGPAEARRGSASKGQGANVKVIGLVCAFIAFVTGLIAAHYWHRASKVPIVPAWRVEPGESDASSRGWQSGTMEAFSKSGQLNKVAARWTAISVALGAISTFLLVFA